MQKYYIKTFGCKVNQYESRLISEKFKNDNFSAAQDISEADIIIFNSCTVTAQADKECEYFLRKVSKFPHKPQIYLTGCMAKNKADYIKSVFPNIKVITNKAELYSDAATQSVNTFDGRSRAFLKIQDGCDSFCSYCIVPYVRNELWSKPPDAVFSEIKNLIKNGFSEIVLTGIHVGKYFKRENLEKDEGGELNFSGLLEKIIQIPLNFRVRISSIELNEIDDKLIRLMKENPQKICRHLHIPLQSGSDGVLKLMNRRYGSETYREKTNKILQALPDLALTADIITGFPGETDERHNETVKFISETSFARLHIFRYSDRNGTRASRFENKVPPEIIKKRSIELFEIDAKKRKEFIQKFIGTKRQAANAGKNKALTDNYITQEIPYAKNGIFEVTIAKEAVI
ncbi:MAG: MiaB/RimO family radical SAM methylthiotransferase [Endomicrobium sp.]|jgi:threonylcarbamoyladenosine tRNA methylthiotransferase MtaB|nr:MiaB/RimO family radical SAM methylthiotransferase [Endomicrobium sp.]